MQHISVVLSAVAPNNGYLYIDEQRDHLSLCHCSLVDASLIYRVFINDTPITSFKCNFVYQ